MSPDQLQKIKGRKLDLVIFYILVLILAVSFIDKQLVRSFIENLMNSFVFAHSNDIDQIERRTRLLGLIVDLFIFLLAVPFFAEGIASVIKRRYPVFAFFRPFDIKYRVGMQAKSAGFSLIICGVLICMPILIELWFRLR